MAAGSVLIVDDDPAVSDLLADILRERGYTVDVASAGSEGLRMAGSRRPDAIILDITLPDTSGADMLPRLRALDDSVPVVMLSGTEDEVLARSLLKAGALDYVRKPFQIEVLERTIALAVAFGRRRPRASGA